MSCKEINKTPDEVRMCIINGSMLWENSIDDTVEDVVNKLDFFEKGMVIPEKDNPDLRYFLYGTMLKRRPSDKSKEFFKSLQGRWTSETSHSSLDNIRRREGGSKVHVIMKDLVNLYYNKVGDIDDIYKKATTGVYAMPEGGFKQLSKLAKAIIKQIEDQQNEIDPTKKALIFTEKPIGDTRKNVGGTIDVLAVFSDRTGAIYDYKTISSSGTTYETIGKGGYLKDELVTTTKRTSYELTISEYKRIMKDIFNLKQIRQSRAIPIHVRFNFKSGEDFDLENNDTLKESFSLIEAGEEESEYLRQVPIGEKTKYEGLNSLLEKQFAQKVQLEKELAENIMSDSERDRKKRLVEKLAQSIQETILSGDIQHLIISLYESINFLEARVREPQFKDAVPNPNYIDTTQLTDLYSELNLYKDMVAETTSYFEALEKSDPEFRKKIEDKLYTLAPKIQRTLTLTKLELENRSISEIEERFKDENGNPIMEDLSFQELNFNRMSEMDHPIFRACWLHIQNAQYHTREKMVVLEREIHTKTDELFKWAKANNLGRQESFDKMINRKTGKLYSMVSEKIMKTIEHAYKTRDIEELQKIYEIKDPKAWKESYDKRRQEKIETLRGLYNDLEPLYDATTGKMVHSAEYYAKKLRDTLRKWELAHDFTYTSAWLNEKNKGYLKMKDSVVKENLSAEYKYIQQHKPLLDYYEMYTNRNKEFRELLGLRGFKKIPDNFIAYIRKDFIDYIAEGQGFFKAFWGGIKEIFEDFTTVRSKEDVFIAERDANGQVSQGIPMLYIDPFIRKDGTIDNTVRSYDLATNLLKLGRMAYGYHHMSTIEAKIKGLKQYMAESTPDRPGVQERDSFGRKIKGFIQDWTTKQGRLTKTYQVLEELTDCYLYGTKFNQSYLKNTRGSIIKAIMRVKQYYSKRTLSFAVIPAFGAAMSARTAFWLEGKKGISFTNKNSISAYKHAAKDWRMYKASALYFDIYAEDPMERWNQALTTNFIAKVADARTYFYPLRKSDEFANDHLVNSMMENWGINGAGQFIRFTDVTLTEKDKEGFKSLVELREIDPKTGRINIKGFTKEMFIQFRNAARSTSANIIGSLSQEDLARYDVEFAFNLMMHYKTWMPGIVREHWGKLRWDDDIKSLKWGRINALFNEFAPYTEESNVDKAKLLFYTKKVLLRSMGKFVIDLIPYFPSKLGFQRVDKHAAFRRYVEWRERDPRNKNITFEQYFDIKQAQMRAAMLEVRTILAFFALIHLMGGNSDDDENLLASYDETWVGRTFYKIITKGLSEMSFSWSTGQFTQMIRNPLPIAGLLTAIGSTMRNALDETLDVLTGEDDNPDRTPTLYYGVQWLYGGTQLARLFEFFKEYEKSPYLTQSFR